MTSTPRLLYVDHTDMELKGEVPWSSEQPVAVVLSRSQPAVFDVISPLGGNRAFHFEVFSGDALAWEARLATMLDNQRKAAKKAAQVKCCVCERQFGLLRRGTPCLRCQQIACSDCSEVPSSPTGPSPPGRVCVDCAEEAGGDPYFRALFAAAAEAEDREQPPGLPSQRGAVIELMKKSVTSSRQPEADSEVDGRVVRQDPKVGRSHGPSGRPLLLICFSCLRCLMATGCAQLQRVRHAVHDHWPPATPLQELRSHILQALLQRDVSPAGIRFSSEAGESHPIALNSRSVTRNALRLRAQVCDDCAWSLTRDMAATHAYKICRFGCAVLCWSRCMSAERAARYYSPAQVVTALRQVSAPFGPLWGRFKLGFLAPQDREEAGGAARGQKAKVPSPQAFL